MDLGTDGGQGFLLVCNGDESYPIMLYEMETPAGLSPGGQPIFDVHAELPLDTAVIAAAETLLEHVSEGARAWWGQATPKRAAWDIVQQTSRPVRGPHVPPRGLPVLKAVPGHPLTGDSVLPRVAELLVGRHRTGHPLPESRT